MSAKLVTVKEIVAEAAKRGRPITESYVRRLARDGEIPGAMKIAYSWVVPQPMAERWLREWTGGE